MSRAKRLKPTSPKPTERPTEKMADPNLVRIHVNTAQIESNPFDFKLRLGQIDDMDDKRILVRELAHVSLSPQFAMALVNLLQQTLKQYGEQIKKPANIPEVTASKN
jgi:Protein of unknown function (DUF3467)